ncbi:MAG: class F sortase [Candidatus Nomurabacteria bacterium]|jgi:hypothetical protein|nr:class F sortase [Candidatus Nomurabacteria bacterium]
MIRKHGLILTNLFSPFMVCFLLAISALGIVSNTLAANLNRDPKPIGQPTAITEFKPKEVVKIEKKQQEEPQAGQAPAQTTAFQPSTSQPAPVPQGCMAARPFIYIPAVGMCMNIMTVGMDGAAVGTPPNTWQAGWFNGSAPLGSGGASFVDGHSPGAFSAIKGVGYGTVITIGLADGNDINYQVTGIENVPLANVDMGKVLYTPGLNLMTCNGTPVGNTYSHRFIVYSSRI